jgi:hypothetical protein
MRRKLGYALSLTFLLRVPAPAEAAMTETDAAENHRVTTRIWDRVQLGSKIWDHAKLVIKEAFVPAGIQFVWLHCAIDDTPESPACSAPTGPNDISLRVYQRSKADFEIKGHLRGGTSMLLSPEGGRGIVHIFFDRVTDVSASYKAPLDVVLGVTVAHEMPSLAASSGACPGRHHEGHAGLQGLAAGCSRFSGLHRGAEEGHGSRSARARR